MSTRGSFCKFPIVELGIGRVQAHGSAIDLYTVAIDVAERAEVGRAECLEAIGGGLGRLASAVHLVVQYHEHAEAPRLGADAARTAPSRFMPASLLSALAGRWAPTATTVLSVLSVR